MSKKSSSLEEPQISDSEIRDGLGRDTQEEICQIIHMKAQGQKNIFIANELGISSATLYRRIADIKRLRSGSPKEISEAVNYQVGE